MKTIAWCDQNACKILTDFLVWTPEKIRLDRIIHK